MGCVADNQSYTLLEENGAPKKRRKLASSWDILPSGQKAQCCLGPLAQEVAGNVNGNIPCPWAGSPSAYSVCSSSSSKSEGDRSSRHVSPPWRSDDNEGHYKFAIGENLTTRYKILNKMGQGTFGQVVECYDRISKDVVAVKIARGLQKYREDAQIEIDVLNVVSKYDISGRRCVQMRDWFDYRNHTCIVFEKLGPSLYDCLKKNNLRPFPIDLVRDIGRQLLDSVAYMHNLKLVHTDLKPENILFVSSDLVKVPNYKSGRKRSSQDDLRLPKSSAIKLIDFGSTTFEDQDQTSVVSTRHYRAPEVILGLGWNYPCDVWSVGCILVELCTGETLFQTRDDLEHLAMMERVLGPLPRQMIKKAKLNPKYLRHGKKLNWPEGAFSRESIQEVRELSKLGNLIKEHIDRSAGLFIDLLQGLLKFEPSQRVTALDALRHPFFNEV